MKNKHKKLKKPSAKSELTRLYAILAEMDPLSEEYMKILARVDKLEEAHARGQNNRLSPSNVIGNMTTIGATALAYWHEDVLGKIATRGLGRTFLPKSLTKR